VCPLTRSKAVIGNSAVRVRSDSVTPPALRGPPTQGDAPSAAPDRPTILFRHRMRGIASFGVAQRRGTTSLYKAPHTADGQPNLNGIWQALNTANRDIQEHEARAGQMVSLGAVGAVPAGLSVVDGNEIPYLPAALAKKKEKDRIRIEVKAESVV
jgi:hypothetical protein